MLQTINSSCEITVPSHSLKKSAFLAIGYMEFILTGYDSFTRRYSQTAESPSFSEALS